MMFHAQGPLRNHCTLLAVLCGKSGDNKQKQPLSDDKPRFPFPELASAGRLEVQVLTNPSTDEFQRVLHSLEPSIVYFQGEQIEDSEEIGPLRWGDVDLSTPESLCGLFSSTLPPTVYLEIPNGEKLAEALHSKGVPYVIYWKSMISCYAGSHFRQALLSVVQSSCSHTCDAFQLAYASFKLYCGWNNNTLASNGQKVGGKPGPQLLGDPPKFDITLPEADDQGEESSSGALPAIKIYDDDVTMRFLICGLSCKLDACLLESLEDGLNALLNIEIRGSKLHNRTSAPPPPLQAGTFSRGVVTMRCDLSTCSSAHISLLVSGSAQTCFNDQLLENHIKNELIENSQLVHALTSFEESKSPSSEPRKSASIACGASVFEVSMKVPTWASQVLRQLAPDVSHRRLVMLGIASIKGLSVASFEKDDADRLLFFCSEQDKESHPLNSFLTRPPTWLIPPPPCRKRSEPTRETKPLISGRGGENGGNVKHKFHVAAMRPIPHTNRHKMLPFSGFFDAERYDGEQAKPSLPPPPPKHSVVGPAPVTHRKSLSSSYQAQQIISLNPLPLKKHGCGRSPIQVCSEEEFLRDVMQFLILRGHSRLVPQGGLAEFPDAILNAKRLDLFNLYREVSFFNIVNVIQILKGFSTEN
ncbi:PREDICTED: AT-rich interactive domain-containing protein 4 isoform X2 [Populus euphratica]|uniref:AT-rich interactive domain-containing protein 4 isoform X2 n=1 Tax=Populus euphratica TaxID=75702 RepID=A0AAJ6V2N9_POPEU|nr:PREDICTED: AT-rich interactive domain-containing protein 4 isoform X2 [Populus euphratica]